MKELTQELTRKIKLLPQESGVYIMKNHHNEIIYIGKAKNLKNRVSQYFHNNQKHPKVQLMVDSIYDFEYVITSSELDAFILEKNLIEKHQPYFNILLKDGKAYPYLKIDLKQKFPKFLVVRKVKNDNAKYFGPYFGSVDIYELLKTINYAFPLRMCDTNFAKQKTKKRECLNFFLGLCKAPCVQKIGEQEYDKIVKKAIRFLMGEEGEILKILETKMLDASKNENFETALMLRNRINLIKKMGYQSLVDIAKDKDVDVFCFLCKNDDCFCNIMNIRHGKVLGSQNFRLENIIEICNDNFEDFVLQYYQHNLMPNQIVLNQIFNTNNLEKYIFSIKNKKVAISNPVKGTLKKLVELGNKNVENFVDNFQSSGDKKLDFEIKSMAELKEVLRLKFLPKRIECYDISHISGTNKTASMVVFENGKKNTKLYRKFKIKTVEGNNDFDSLKEVLDRRVQEFNINKDNSFSQKPDIVLIDGGKGQLSSVFEILKTTNLKDVKLISIAKKEELIYQPESPQPIVLQKNSFALRVLQQIRDESHRFAITFHRKLRDDNMKQLEILKIDGLGRVLQKRLYEKFSNAVKISKASVDEIATVQGVSKKMAEKIKQYLKK